MTLTFMVPRSALNVVTVCLLSITLFTTLTRFEVLLPDNGRIVSCGHEICFGMPSLSVVDAAYLIGTDCSLNLKNSAFDHDGIL